MLACTSQQSDACGDGTNANRHLTDGRLGIVSQNESGYYCSAMTILANMGIYREKLSMLT